MSKRSFITNLTPLPKTISREAAIAHLHDHHAMIELNPLVLKHERTDPPTNAAHDEANNAVWYEITDRINYLPGGAVKGEVVYKACFYNLPRGLQTHVFAPGGVDIRSKWSVGGTLPGEPKEPLDLGSNVPREGLYIKEEVDLRCSVFMSGFVKRNLKKSHLVVADKIVARAGQANGQSNTSLWERPGLRSVEHGSVFSRDPSMTTQSTASSPSQETPRPYQEVHMSYPPHCACEGSSHNPACSFFHPDDLRQEAGFLRVQTGNSKPFYAISLPSASSYSQPSSASHSPQADDPYPRELLGSPAWNGCFCTGALHDEACPSYGILRIPPSPATSIQQSPAIAYGLRALADVSIEQHLGRRPSELAELAATRDWPDRNLMPAPLRSRGNSPAAVGDRTPAPSAMGLS